jgi:anti-sigma B factor antagonist
MPWSPRHNQLRFAVEREEQRVTVRLAGELDCASAATAHLVLARAGSDATEIVLDLSRVVFLDAAGLRFLISAQRRARAAHRRLSLRRPSRSVSRLIELTGARPLLAIEDTQNGDSDLAAAEEITPILDAAIGLAMRIAESDRSTAELRDPRTGGLRIVAQRGFNRPVLESFEIMSDGESIGGTVLLGGQSVWVADMARSSILAGSPALDVLLDAGVRAMTSWPAMSSDGQLIAVLSLYRRLPTDWTAEQKVELEQLGRSVAHQCLEALRLHSQLTGAATV